MEGCTDPVDRSFCINPAKPSISGNESRLLTSSNNEGNQWYFNGEEIEDATSKTYQAAEDGSYTVVTTIDNCSSATSHVYVLTTVGLEDDASVIVKIFPNPVTNEVYVQTPGSSVVSMLDLNGRVIFSRTSGGDRAEQFNVSSLASGFLPVQDQYEWPYNREEVY